MSLAETAPRQAVSSDSQSTETRQAGNGLDRRGPMRPAVLEPSRRRLSGRLAIGLFQVGDICALICGVIVSQRASTGWDIRLLAQLVGACAAPMILGMTGAYAFSRRQGLISQILTTSAAMGATLGAVALTLILGGRSQWAPEAIIQWSICNAVPLVGLHIIWWGLVRHWRASGRLTPNLIVVGATGAATRLINTLLESGDAHVLGLFDDRAARSPESVNGVPVLGGTKDLVGHRIMPYVDRLVISVPSKARQRVRELIERLQVLPNEIVLLLDRDDDGQESETISRIADVPLAHISGPPSNEVRALFKRAQDFLVGLLA